MHRLELLLPLGNLTSELRLRQPIMRCDELNTVLSWASFFPIAELFLLFQDFSTDKLYKCTQNWWYTAAHIFIKHPYIAGPLLQKDGEHFNKHWGHLSRAGLNDESQFTRQVCKYSDVYTSRVANFVRSTPYMYFRSPSMSLVHDQGENW